MKRRAASARACVRGIRSVPRRAGRGRWARQRAAGGEQRLAAGEAAVVKLWRRFAALDVRVEATSLLLQAADGSGASLEQGAIIGDVRDGLSDPVDTTQVGAPASASANARVRGRAR